MQKILVSQKDELISTMHSSGVIPVFHHPEANTWMEIIAISYRCGVRMLEFTHQRDSRGLRMFSWLVEEAKQFPGLTLGVGTVLDPLTAERYIQSGAGFIASPFLQPRTAEVCIQNNVLWMPGCSTVEDVQQARDQGAEAVTILSGNILGPEFLRQVNKKFPQMLLVPSSGVGLRENNLRAWFDAGAICVRLGEALFSKEAVAVRDWVKIETNLYSTLDTILRIKKSKTLSIL